MHIQDISFTDIHGNDYPSALNLMRQVLRDTNVQTLGARLNFTEAQAIHKFIRGAMPDEQEWNILKSLAINVILTSDSPLTAVDLDTAYSKMESSDEATQPELT